LETGSLFTGEMKAAGGETRGWYIATNGAGLDTDNYTTVSAGLSGAISNCNCEETEKCSECT